MTSPSYEKNKKYIMTWRSKNYETTLEINKQYKRRLDAWRKLIRELPFNLLIQ
jgi:hypothetical protein